MLSFSLCLAQIFPTTVFLTTQALRGRLHTALRSSGTTCDIRVDSRLQGHLVHPTPPLNLRGNHEPERGRESPTVTWPTAEPDTLSSAPLSHSKRSSVRVDRAAESSPGFAGRKLPRGLQRQQSRPAASNRFPQRQCSPPREGRPRRLEQPGAPARGVGTAYVLYRPLMSPALYSFSNREQLTS